MDSTAVVTLIVGILAVLASAIGAYIATGVRQARTEGSTVAEINALRKQIEKQDTKIDKLFDKFDELRGSRLCPAHEARLAVLESQVKQHDTRLSTIEQSG